MERFPGLADMFVVVVAALPHINNGEALKHGF
jgi:hypothetical protein